jgi:hypothetical protein
MNIGRPITYELQSNVINSVSNPLRNSIFDYVTLDMWTNISRKIWNPVLIAMTQESINNSLNELIQ